MKPYPHTFGEAEFASLISRRRGTDFGSLERTHQQAVGERRWADFDDHPCAPEEDGAMLVGVGVFVFVGLALAYLFGPALVSIISRVMQ